MLIMDMNKVGRYVPSVHILCINYTGTNSACCIDIKANHDRPHAALEYSWVSTRHRSIDH